MLAVYNPRNSELTATVISPDQGSRIHAATRLIRAAPGEAMHQCLTALAEGTFWHSTNNADVTDVAKQSWQLAEALTTIIAGAKTTSNVQFLVMGIDTVSTSVGGANEDWPKRVVTSRLVRMQPVQFVAHRAWAYIEDFYTPDEEDDDSFETKSEEVPQYSPRTHAEFDANRLEYEIAALQRFGSAVRNLILAASADEANFYERIDAVKAFLFAIESVSQRAQLGLE